LLSRVLPAEAKSAAAEYDHRAWIRSAIPLVLMSLIAPLTAEIGIIALGAIKGAGPVGLFSIANRGASFVGFLFTAATYPLLPVLARLHATRDRAGLQRLLTRAARGLTLASLPFAGGLVVFTHPILGLFGAGFTHAATPLRLLVAGYFVNVVGGFSGVALLMTGHEKAVAKCTAAAAVLFVGSGAALVPRYGALGLSIATVVQLVASNVLLSVALWRHERLVAPAVPASVVTAS
jgi:O-antigen/teichoic acid export membrane protein